MKKIKLLTLILIVLPYTLLAWGDGDKLSDGSCKFDLDTGYLDSALYLKDNESFLIINGGDSRYGMTSTIYDTLTCEKVTSGDSVKSNFSGLMERKGFIEENLNSNQILNKSFQHKIKFLKNSNEIIVHVEPISSSITQELKTLLASLSDKSASSQITVSDSTREFLSYKSFYTSFFEKMDALPNSEINYAYTLALIDKLKLENVGVNGSRNLLLAKKEELNQQIARLEEDANNKMFATEVKSIQDVPQWMTKMAQLGKQDKVSKFIPTIMKLSDFGKKLTLSNFFTSTEYLYVLKDLKLNKVRKIQNNDYEYGIILDYPNKNIYLTQKPTCTSTGTTSTSEFSCGFLWGNTCVGTYAKYKCRGNTSAIANIEQQLMGTVKVATLLNKGWTYQPMISRYTKSTPNYSSSSSNRRYQEQQEQEELMKQQKNTARKSCLAMCEGISTEGKGIIWDNSPQRKCKDRCWKI
jgi:hypothetical protein